MQTTTPLLPEETVNPARIYIKVDSLPLDKFLHDSSCSIAHFSEDIGYSASCVSAWLRCGEMPKSIGVIVKHLQAKHDSTLTTSINVYGTHENIDAVLPLLARFDLTVNNR